MSNALATLLTPDPVPVPPLAVQAQLRKLHKLDFLETVAVRQAASLIGEWELTTTNFEAGLKQFERLLQCLHNYAMNERNKWAVAVCKAVSIALCNFQAGQLHLSENNINRLAKLAKPVKAKPGVEDFGAFRQEMLLYLFNACVTRYHTVATLQELGEEDLSYFDDFRQPEEVEEAVHSLLIGITELQRYGVKSCIMQDNLLHPVDHAWVMNDGPDIMGYLQPEGTDLARLDPPLAVAMLARRRQIVTTRPTQRKESFGITPFRSLSFNFQSHTTANLYSDGRVTLDVGWGMIPLRGVFDEAGVGELYGLFHLVQLLRIYDLVVSVEAAKSQGVPPWPTPRQSKQREPGEPGLTWRKLVVPRIRTLRDPAALGAAIEREIGEDLAFTRSYGGGAAESREIQGFLRRLHAGHQATDRARELAWKERRWEIPEGYTYVKKHDWGTGPNRTAGHVAVRRS